MSSNLQITQLAFNEVTLIPQLKLMLSKNWASSKFWTNLQTWCAIIPEQWIKKFKDTIILEVCTGTRVGEGKQTNGAAAAAALTHGPHSQPPPTSLCSSEKKPLLFPSTGEGGRSLGWTAAQLRHSTRHQKKKETGTGLPTPVRRPLYSLPASAHKHRLISSVTTTVVIVFSCYLIGSVRIVAFKTSLTMTLLLTHVLW